MSNQRIWERRVVAGLMDHLSEVDLGVIESLEIEVEGSTEHMEFAHEPLSDVEAQRVRRSFEAVAQRLGNLYDRLGGTAGASVDEQDADPTEDEQDESISPVPAAPAEAEEAEEPDEGDDDALDDEIVDQWAQHPAMSEVNA